MLVSKPLVHFLCLSYGETPTCIKRLQCSQNHGSYIKLVRKEMQSEPYIKKPHHWKNILHGWLNSRASKVKLTTGALMTIIRIATSEIVKGKSSWRFQKGKCPRIHTSAQWHSLHIQPKIKMSWPSKAVPGIYEYNWYAHYCKIRKSRNSNLMTS